MTWGFADPEVQKKAIEKSKLVRQNNAVLQTDATEFSPSHSMLKLMETALDLEAGNSIRQWCNRAGIARTNWYVWLKIPGFKEWWKKTYFEGLKQYESEWLKIGLSRMRKENPDAFKYWDVVGEKIFGYLSKIVHKEEKSEQEEELIKVILGEVKESKKLREAKEITVKDGNVISDTELEEINKGENK